MSANTITVPSTLSTALIRVTVVQGQPRSFCASLVHKLSGRQLAFIGDTPATDCRITIDECEYGTAELWIGRTAFDIPAREAQHAAATLEIRLIDMRKEGGAA